MSSMATVFFGLILSVLAFGGSATVLKATDFVPYPGYSGNLSVAGTVFLQDVTDGQMMFFHLTGVDGECTAPTNDANSCGVHIHEGMTCETADDIGGHYWDSSFVAEDPWATVVYAVADGQNMTAGAGVTVETGVSTSDNLGRAFVVHDSSGARIACAVLASPSSDWLSTETFVPYAGYTGSLDQVDGLVLFYSSGDEQTMYYSLSGVDTACNSTPPAAANACGVHIHVGTNCSVAAGGHYWSSSVVTDDPWSSVTYDASSGNGFGFAQTVVTGLSTAEVNDAVFVVHDSTGARIACAEIGTIEQATTTIDEGETDVSFAAGGGAPSLVGAVMLAMLYSF